MVAAEYIVSGDDANQATERAMQSVLPLRPPQYVDDSWQCDTPVEVNDQGQEI